MVLFTLLACDAPPLADAPPTEFVEVGQDEGGGNVVGIKAWMDPTAFSSADRFDFRLRGWMDQADAQGWLHEDTIVVLPEHIGTWLVIVDEPGNVQKAPTAEKALRRMIPLHLNSFLSLRKDAPADDANQYAVFAMKADDIAVAWQDVVAGIAMDYGVTVVGGSALLPEPELADGEIIPMPGRRLRNVTMVMGNDGRIMSDLVLEVYPTKSEQETVEPGEPATLGTSSTPLGEVALLLSYDAWFPTAWSAMAFGAPRVALSPHYFSPDGTWTESWSGYTGFDEPADVDQGDVNSITLEEASLRYGLVGRALDAGIEEAMMVPMVGPIWDLGSDGAVTILHKGETTLGPHNENPVVANLWLPLR